jgi:spermidine/putrescine-binding protein
VPGVNDITYCTADVMVIPKGAKNKKEAFEFIAYVNSQPVMEKLCSLHCKISPLAKVSDEFIRNHGNPYVKVFDDLAASPRAYGTPSVPIFPQVSEEISNFVQNLAQMRVTPEQGLAEMQVRLQGKYDAFMEKQRLRRVAEDQGQGRQ